MLSIPFEVQCAVDIPKREVTAYATGFGNRDLQNMRAVEGAFTKTIAENGPEGGNNQIKFFRDHCDLVGVPRHLEQDAFGLLTVSFVSKTAKGDETLTLLKDGALNRYSYRGKIVRARMAIDGQDADGNDVETIELMEIQLREYGPCDLQPVNPLASVLAVKSLDPDQLDLLAELPYLLKSFTLSRSKLASGERRVAQDLLRLYEQLGSQSDTLKALLAPESGTSPRQATPPKSTPAEAEQHVDLTKLLESVRKLRQVAA